MLQIYTADLHLHTCLSPCGSLDMTPIKIIKEAVEKDLSMIAVTDHNSAENIPAVIKASQGKKITVIPGMEISTSEEIHIVALFGLVEDAFRMQEIVFKNLPPGENNEDIFGTQVIANELDEVEGFNKRLLISATNLSLNKVVDYIHQFNGLAIAAHIDRGSYSVISQLGFIPDNVDFDAVEISKRLSLDKALQQFNDYKRFPFVTSSDSHYLEDIGTSRTRFMAEEASFNEFKLSLSNNNGRKITYEK